MKKTSIVIIALLAFAGPTLAQEIDAQRLARIDANLAALNKLPAMVEAVVTQQVQQRKQIEDVAAKVDDLAMMLRATNARLDAANEPKAATTPVSAWGPSASPGASSWGQGATTMSAGSCANGQCGGSSGLFGRFRRR